MSPLFYVWFYLAACNKSLTEAGKLKAERQEPQQEKEWFKCHSLKAWKYFQPLVAPVE